MDRRNFDTYGPHTYVYFVPITFRKHNEVKHNEEKLSKHNEATKSTQFKYKDAI